jgi:hypothetical protein
MVATLNFWVAMNWASSGAMVMGWNLAPVAEHGDVALVPVPLPPAGLEGLGRGPDVVQLRKRPGQ